MLRLIADRIVFALGLDPASKLGGAAHYFIYDAVKILLLLFGLIFVIGVLRSYLPQEKVKAWLGAKNIRGHAYASLFGAVTPFCSCSSIPIVLGFLKAGVPLGAVFSFLITSPLINEYLVVLMFGFFGWKITALYVVSGILIGVISGLILSRMKLEKYLVADLIPLNSVASAEKMPEKIRERIRFGLHEARTIVGKLWAWVLAGVAVGAVIHNYVPQEQVEAIMAKTGFFSVPIATILGVPMYGSCASIVPIAVVLFQKGIPLGTAMAFMMAVAALSLPEAIMLRRAMKLQLIGIFFGVVALAIMATGYAFNFLEPLMALSK